MKPRTVHLTAEQEAELKAIRDHHRLPYMRERASAILKVSQGRSVREVALYGLLQRRDEHAVGDWLDRYEAEGVAGLVIRSGRGRKPVFSPSDSGRSARGRRSSATPVTTPTQD